MSSEGRIRKKGSKAGKRVSTRENPAPGWGWLHGNIKVTDSGKVLCLAEGVETPGVTRRLSPARSPAPSLEGLLMDGLRF
jgi:hypothetical protein